MSVCALLRYISGNGGSAPGFSGIIPLDTTPCESVPCQNRGGKFCHHSNRSLDDDQTDNVGFSDEKHNIKDEDVIKAGNRVAHGGDTNADAELYVTDKRRADVRMQLYGVVWIPTASGDEAR